MRLATRLLSMFGLLASFGASDALASGCKSIRMDGPGQPFAQIPAYDQRRLSKLDQGICYAIVAAELIDADRFHGGESMSSLTSPVSVGLYFKSGGDGRRDPRSSSENPIQTGDVLGALESADGRLVCDQRHLEKYVSLIGQSARGSIPNQVLTSPEVSSLENFFAALDDQTSRFQRLGTGTAPEYGLNPYFLRRQGPGSLESFSSRLSEVLRSDGQIERAIGALGVICASREHDVDLRGRINTMSRVPDFGSGYAVLGPSRSVGTSLQLIGETGEFVKKAKSLLNSERPVPIAVSIPFDDLVSGRDGYVPDHAAVIIGQRPVPGTDQCEFLVRNSYGPACTTRENESYPCENGSVWVPERRLFENMADMTWISR